MQGEASPVSGVSGRYAQALFDLAQDAGSTQAVARDLNDLKAMIESSAHLARMIASPALSTADQIKAIDALLAKAGIKGILANFIHFVAAKRRLPALAGIIEAFSRLDAQANNIHAAQVVTAHALSDAQKNDLRRALEARAGGSVEMSVRIDADIIGGLIVKLGSRMIDASLKTKLNSLRLAMQES